MAEDPRGKLKIFMGYAAGVGKTYQMLEEAQEIKAKGIDVAIGYFEPHGRKDTIAKAEGLELIPRKSVDYRGFQLRGDGYRRHSGQATPGRRSRRISAHQRPRIRRAPSGGKMWSCCWTQASTS